jgi:hypothetical protein
LYSNPCIYFCKRLILKTAVLVVVIPTFLIYGGIPIDLTKLNDKRVLIAALIFILIDFISSFGKNDRIKKEHEKKLELHSKRCNQILEKHGLEYLRYKRNLQSYPDLCEKADLQKKAEDEVLANFRSQKNEYEKQQSEYNKQWAEYNQKIMKARELLWERARVCMRCGTAYLDGEGKTHDPKTLLQQRLLSVLAERASI